MRIKNVAYLFCVLLLFSGFVYRTEASSINSVSFHGVGVTVDLTFPEEAHLPDNISHNLTITAYEYVTSLNITLFIYAPLNSTWQIIDLPHNIDWRFPLGVNQSLPKAEIWFTSPQNADGTLYCRLDVQTNQSADYPSFTFYTTQVRNMTYSELLSAHNELIANYSALNSSYIELNATYNALRTEHDELNASFSTLYADYGTLRGNYTTLLDEYKTLNTTYNGLSLEHANLTVTYNLLSANYDNLNSSFNAIVAKNNALQSDYDSLNSTHYNLQANYNLLEGNYNSILAKNNALQSDYNSLNSTYYPLQTSYNSLLGTKNALQTAYNLLNSTDYTLQTNYNSLQVNYDSLNQLYAALENEVNDLRQRIESSEKALSSDQIVMTIFTITVGALIALIAYIKRKKQEPYVVIRKETVSLEPDKSS